MIGSLRWAVELGRVEILLEVALMSKHLALPREGHLEKVLNIMGYICISNQVSELANTLCLNLLIGSLQNNP